MRSSASSSACSARAVTAALVAGATGHVGGRLVGSAVYEIGGADRCTYRDPADEVARQAGA